MKAAFRLGSFDDIHLEYRVHRDNASAAACGITPTPKHLRISEAAARGYEALVQELDLSSSERLALCRRLSNEYFWKQGYARLFAQNIYDKLFRSMKRCLRIWT